MQPLASVTKNEEQLSRHKTLGSNQSSLAAKLGGYLPYCIFRNKPTHTVDSLMRKDLAKHVRCLVLGFISVHTHNNKHFPSRKITIDWSMRKAPYRS